jgi:L-lactate dehydrogenase complex protein LldG
MSARERILAAVRGHQPPAVPLPAVPRFDADLPPLRAWFEASLFRMGGRLVEPPPGTDLETLLRQRFPDARVICSATDEIRGTLPLAQVREPRELDLVDLAVVRAAFGVAETGSVFLSEAELGINALGYLAQHLVVLLDPAAILGNLHHAWLRPEFRRARYAVLMTGPSATADIEGVLVHGAQGVRSLTVILTGRRPPAAATSAPSGA